MHPVAHHAGEQTLAPLLLLGSTWLWLLAAGARQHLHTARTKLTRPTRTP